MESKAQVNDHGKAVWPPTHHLVLGVEQGGEHALTPATLIGRPLADMAALLLHSLRALLSEEVLQRRTCYQSHRADLNRQIKMTRIFSRDRRRETESRVPHSLQDQLAATTYQTTINSSTLHHSARLLSRQAAAYNHSIAYLIPPE